MKIKCSFCEALFNDTMEHCPNCGAINPGVVRTHSKQPLTVDELKQWYESKGLPPYDVTRFFIGENYKKPRAFGIYQDLASGNFVVYKNKDNGQRAVRYEGTDEAYAVNEIFQRLKQEIIQQKKANLNKSGSGYPKSNTYKKSDVSVKKASKISLLKMWLIILIVIVAFIIYGMVSVVAEDATKTGYYRYNDRYYYHINKSYDDGWFYYDEEDDDWYETKYDYVPEILQHNTGAIDFFYTPDWTYETQITDFTDTALYDQYSSSSYSSNDWDDDDYDYDWDSGDSWDSGGSDWDSDW